jgi:hypothetical protein
VRETQRKTQKKHKNFIYNEWQGDDFLNNVMVEEPGIHRPSSNDFSITFL